MNLFNRSIKIKVSRIDERAELPKKNHDNKFADAAYDLFSYAAVLSDPSLTLQEVFQPTNLAGGEIVVLPGGMPENSFSLDSGERRLIGTGIRVAIPDGYWIKFHERSGLANKGIHILGGVIDSGYTGELKVIMYNSGCNTYTHDCSKAICQFTVEKVTKSHLELISQEDMKQEASLRERQDKGFGSSDGK